MMEHLKMMEHLQGRGYVADGDSAAPKDPSSAAAAAAAANQLGR